jgi:hypothetical protein
MFGLICNDEISLVSHCLFLNFRQALYNTFGKDKFKDIKQVSELDGLTHLFIIDEHFGPNVNVWKKQELVNRVNDLNIKVIIFNFEKIYNSAFPWNVDHQRFVEQFKNLTQFLTDMDDLKKLKTPFINKQLLSKDTYVTKRDNTKITNKVLFIGQMEGNSYTRRRETLNAVSQYLPLEIISTNRRYTYDEFLDTLSKYKYVLNPLGAGDFLNLRYYEIIKLGSIPIQQIVPEMKNYYSELSDYSINFSSPEELRDVDVLSFQQNNKELYLEDYFQEVDLPSFL